MTDSAPQAQSFTLADTPECLGEDAQPYHLVIDGLIGKPIRDRQTAVQVEAGLLCVTTYLLRRHRHSLSAWESTNALHPK